jgi:hypothetical protein
MKMEIWYCSETGGQQLLESCKTEDTGFSEDNCLKLLKWANNLFPMLDWQRDDYEQYCARCIDGIDDRYFLAYTENNYKTSEG